MQITITTQRGVFLVPREKEMELISWLEINAVKAGQQAVYENTSQGQANPNIRQLITERDGGTF